MSAMMLNTCLTTGNGRKTIAETIGIKKENDKEEDFLSRRSTTTINGIFVLLIFFSHSTQYLTLLDNPFDSLYRHFQAFHNQWVVTTFLVFSGYGVMMKIIQEGDLYLKKYPRNRLLKTLANYDIAVIVFICVNILLGIQYSGSVIAGSFIGITGIGNSNWYIFTILVMYLVSYFVAIFFKNNYKLIAGIVTACSVSYIAVAQLTGLPSRFVSTVITYALGMWVAIYKGEIEKVLKSRPFVALLVITIPIILTYKLRGNDYIMNINSCFFVLLIVWFMSHFEIRSNILYFLGVHAFSIYILQRLPMLVISRYFTINGAKNYVFVMVCLLTTVCLSVVFDKLFERVDQLIIKS